MELGVASMMGRRLGLPLDDLIAIFKKKYHSGFESIFGFLFGTESIVGYFLGTESIRLAMPKKKTPPFGSLLKQ